MTSISLWAYAAMQVTSAQHYMTSAAAAATHSIPRPGPGGEDLPVGGRPEVEAPEAMVPAHPLLHARQLAGQGIDAINAALGVRTSLAAEVVTALTNASSQATAGVRLVQEATSGLIEPGAISARFQSSALWLGLAGSLLQLDHDTRWPIDHPLLPGGPKLPEGLERVPAR